MVKQAVRTFRWQRIHWMLAFLFAFPWMTLAITGAGLGFSDEIDRALNPDLRNVPPKYGQPPLALNQLVQAVEQQLSPQKLLAIYPARTPFDTTRVDYLAKGKRGNRDIRGNKQQVKQAFFNPVTGQFKGERNWQDALPIWLANWHVYLSQGQWIHWVLLVSCLGLGSMVFTGWLMVRRRLRDGSHLSVHAQVGVGLSFVWMAMVLSAVWVGFFQMGEVGFSARSEMSLLNASKGYDLNQPGLSHAELLRLPLPLPNEVKMEKGQANICPESQQIVRIRALPRGEGIELLCQPNADYGVWSQTRWRVKPLEGQKFQLERLPQNERWTWALHSGTGLGLFGRILWVWGSLALLYMVWSGYRIWRER